MTQPATLRRKFLVHSLALPVLLAGCGGGGSDSGPAPTAPTPPAAGTPPAPPPAATSPLVLSLQGDQEAVVGVKLVNRATSPAGRVVTYTSSDSRIATVTDAGEVEALARGTATITATEAGADGRSASFRMNVLPAVLKGRFIDGTTIKSAHTGVTYPYTVYLPASYAGGTKRYPVMYMTDGQWTPLLYQLADKLDKQVILVMIHQGPDTPDMNVGAGRRMTDYLPQGAPAYLRFMKEEMAPLIESTYRANADRTFYGVSAGGTLGIIDMFLDPAGKPFFNRYVLGDPAIFLLSEENATQEETRFKTNRTMPVTLFMTSIPTASPPATLLGDYYKGRNYQGMTVQVTEYDLPHLEIALPTFTEAMQRYF